MTNASLVTLYGAVWSVYVRIARLALEEKEVPYELVEVDVFSDTGVPSDYLERQPFGRIPAFQHGAFTLYETGAIVRYVDEEFPGPDLQPKDPQPRARVNQIVGILDAYAYRALIREIYVERVVAPGQGRRENEEIIADALPRAALCLSELNRLSTEDDFLCGSRVTIADLYAAPMFACFTQAPDAVALLDRHQKLCQWWSRFAKRHSMTRTQP
ncbi:MAG: glutathione S-transferase family protein [Paraburkholderia sp.]|uniref:glutathione S-transferase family protein n=1 Tax=Paraburkholderia sp. TaxID=1926495 RepID=UPI001217C621|nr:glutathione S-transferase family protein [Paraburkholderia sp.]TAL97514.1 MAG: glutathione S-transferase family protein [Paraburkholderia sp.]